MTEDICPGKLHQRPSHLVYGPVERKRRVVRATAYHVTSLRSVPAAGETIATNYSEV